jgi:hypothetical protein
VNDTFTEVTRTPWTSRIGKSAKGLLGGLVLLVAGIALLFWNEGRAVKTHKALEESQGTVVSIDAFENTQPSMEGKLVHISGTANTDQTLSDDVLPVSIAALKLQRFVETYQWQETSHSEERKTMGGDTETVTTYQYSKVWSTTKINSSDFKKQGGHENPAGWLYENQTWTAPDIRIGNYALASEHKKLIDNFQSLPLPENSEFPKELKKTNNMLYTGSNQQEPAIGDQRIKFKYIPAQVYSAIGDMRSSILHEHIASNGHRFALLQAGSYSANSMFEQAKSDNEQLTWILRLAGTAVLIFAFITILKPLSVLADVVPLIGNIVEVGTGVIGFLLGLIVALVTICLAWIFYRPMVGIALLVAIGAIIYWLKRKSSQAAQTIAQQKNINLPINTENPNVNI